MSAAEQFGAFAHGYQADAASRLAVRRALRGVEAFAVIFDFEFQAYRSENAGEPRLRWAPEWRATLFRLPAGCDRCGWPALPFTGKGAPDFS